MDTPQDRRRIRNMQAGLCPCGRPTEPNRKKCGACQSSINKTVKKWKQRNRDAGLCRCGRELASITKCQFCLDRGTALSRTNFLATLDAYDGRKCACCGENILQFLTIDHISNDGYKTRSLGRGSSLYARLKRLGYPQGYQVLCFNCNLAKARNNGSCPHGNATEWLDSSNFQGSRRWVMNKLSKRHRFVDALSHYGGECICCNESNPFFLTFDHIYENGAEHRQSIGTDIVIWLRKNNFPADVVQVMCVNCNSGRQRNNGTCPHIEINPCQKCSQV